MLCWIANSYPKSFHVSGFTLHVVTNLWEYVLFDFQKYENLI